MSTCVNKFQPQLMLPTYRTNAKKLLIVIYNFRSVKKVVSLIVSELFQTIVQFPENCDAVAAQFLQKGGFPSVYGLVDGTLINIDAPVQNEQVFVDRHGNHSLNVMMVCSPDRSFYYVTSRWPGSAHDSRVLRNSSLCCRMESGRRPFPDAVILGKIIKLNPNTVKSQYSTNLTLPQNLYYSLSQEILDMD